MSTQQAISNKDKEWEKIIFLDSDEAAQYKENEPVSGWFGRNGRFYGTNERLARIENCTHYKCNQCGIPVLTSSGHYCQPCLEEIKDKNFKEMPVVEWDGETPLCLYDGDEFFYSEEEIESYCDEYGIKPSSLQLLLTEPEYLSEIDTKDLFKNGDVFSGELTMSDLVPNNIWDMIDNLNKAIRDSSVAYWIPGTKRVQLRDPL